MNYIYRTVLLLEEYYYFIYEISQQEHYNTYISKSFHYLRLQSILLTLFLYGMSHEKNMNVLLLQPY